MCKFQFKEVRSQATVRTMWCSRPDAHQLATSVWTMRTFRPDAHQCLETLNCSRLHPSGRNGKSFGHFKSSRRIQCSSASVRTTWQYHPDAIQCSSRNWISCPDTDRETATVRTHFRLPGRFLHTSQCFNYDSLLEYRIEKKLVSLER
jgi:hypothetical protein